VFGPADSWQPVRRGRPVPRDEVHDVAACMYESVDRQVGLIDSVLFYDKRRFDPDAPFDDRITFRHYLRDQYPRVRLIGLP